jgi:small-conductance mechanosensitive channel
MTMRVVVLRDLEGTMHVIPNGQLNVVSNKTRGWARAVVDISVPYTEDVDRAIAVVRDEAAQLSNDPVWSLQLDGPVEVLGVESMTDNSVVIRTLLKTQPGSQWSVAREFRRRLINRFSKEAIESPFQQRRVHVTVKGAPPGEAVAAAASAGATG